MFMRSSLFRYSRNIDQIYNRTAVEFPMRLPGSSCRWTLADASGLLQMLLDCLPDFSHRTFQFTDVLAIPHFRLPILATIQKPLLYVSRGLANTNYFSLVDFQLCVFSLTDLVLHCLLYQYHWILTLCSLITVSAPSLADSIFCLLLVGIQGSWVVNCTRSSNWFPVVYDYIWSLISCYV